SRRQRTGGDAEKVSQGARPVAAKTRRHRGRASFAKKWGPPPRRRSYNELSGAELPARETELASLSEPGRLVDGIAQLLSGREGAAVLDDDLQPALVEVGPVSRHVRGQQHVGHGPQRVRGRQRLQFINVERRTGDLARLQRRDQVVELRRHAA